MSNSENDNVSNDAPVMSDSSGDQEDSHAKRVSIVVLSLLLLAVMAFIPYWLSRRVPYYSLSPGPTYSVDNIVDVPAKQKVSHKGQFYFTTVDESAGRLRRLQYYLTKWFDKESELQPAKNVEAVPQVYCASSADALATGAMSDSQKTALSVALRRMEKPVTTTIKPQVQIFRIIPESAAVGKLKLCDTIVSIDGVPIDDVGKPREIVRQKKPGDSVTVVVKGVDKKERTVVVKLGSDRKTGGPLLGIYPYDLNSQLLVTTPLGIDFHKTEVGGPSAGLAFTLGLIDDLTPGELTGGKAVATTGQIDLKGNVEAIGGVAEKTHSVYDKGIRLFLVPADNYKEAKKAAPKGLVVVPVRNLQDALDALKKYGGDVSSIPAEVDLSKF